MIDFRSGREPKSSSFDYIQIRIASPEEIRGPRDSKERERLELQGQRTWWSWGEVTKPETINYRSFKPERDGLFCERIFGPVKDWECHCGKYKRIRYRGVICDRCGVEVTLSKVRRERMGHIELAVPVAHIWFFKTLPSPMGNLLDMTLRDLERVIYYTNYVVIEPGEQEVQERELLDEDRFLELRTKAKTEGDTAFRADIGSPAIRSLLERINVDKLADELRETVAGETSQHRKKQMLKRLKIVDAMRNSGNAGEQRNDPRWMILDVVPVIPPDLRPLVPLDGGRFATSDLNDLYRRVINRNNRLQKLILHRAPEVILRNEKRMLQEAVDALFDNGRRSKAIRGRGKRPLKSLSDMLKGKQGRFRQNLLGKRVDYSGRSVIVVGPELRLHQCGLPKAMAVELFKPFIIHQLVEQGIAEAVKRAKKIVEKESPEVYEILEEIIEDHPVLLNRAPTLHRLGIQAFEPVLVEGKAIRIHPLVCAAFNADFDGDQMAVHVPLSFEAQLESRLLMLSSNNILKPSDGRPVAEPSQDIVLGCYVATKAPAEFARYERDEKAANTLKKFVAIAEIEMALAHGTVQRQSPVRFLVEDTRGNITNGERYNTVIDTWTHPNSDIADAMVKAMREDKAGFNPVFMMFDSGSRGSRDQIRQLAGMRGLMAKPQKKLTGGIGEIIESPIKSNFREGLSVLEYFISTHGARKGLADTALKTADAGYLTRRLVDVAQDVTVTEEDCGTILGLEMADLEEAVGILAAQSIGEPGTQLTLRTFHIGGTAARIAEQTVRKTKVEGVIEYGDRLTFVETPEKQKVVTSYEGELVLKAAKHGAGEEGKLSVHSRFHVPLGATLMAGDGQKVAKDGVLFTWDPYTNPILTDVPGVVRFVDIVEDETVREELDELTGRRQRVIIEDRDKKLHPHIEVVQKKGEKEKRVRDFVIPEGAQLAVEDGQEVYAGQVLAKVSREAYKTRDITGGLPRVAELFEARRPKDPATISEIDGVVRFGDLKRGKREIWVHGEEGEPQLYEVPAGKHLRVHEGDRVRAGDRLTEGPVNPHDILRIKGPRAVQEYLLNEVQEVYRLQGVKINDKHIGVIVRQMLQKVKIVEPGDTEFLEGENVDKQTFSDAKDRVVKKGGKPPTNEPLLLGITKASLTTQSFISAASFQETTRVLTDAAIRGARDDLLGLKENIIIGHLIPAGTGIYRYHEIEIEPPEGFQPPPPPPEPVPGVVPSPFPEEVEAD